MVTVFLPQGYVFLTGTTEGAEAFEATAVFHHMA